MLMVLGSGNFNDDDDSDDDGDEDDGMEDSNDDNLTKSPAPLVDLKEQRRLRINLSSQRTLEEPQSDSANLQYFTRNGAHVECTA